MLRSALFVLFINNIDASHLYGDTMTYYPKETLDDGSVRVVLRYKLNSGACNFGIPWTCTGNCGNQTVTLNTLDKSNGEWCQQEGIINQLLPNNGPFQLQLESSSWYGNKNGILSLRARTDVELRKRSDTGKANTSPQTTILPAVRVPSNCQRNFNLLTFDPEGDIVQCRNGMASLLECNPCTLPSVLSISPSCNLSFTPTNSNSTVGSYVVQVVMEDFPRKTINLTHTNGTVVEKTTSDTISKIPIQFVFKVDPAVPSCTEGVYLPRFLPPTPDHKAQLCIPAGQTLEINITAEATQSSISTLLFSGPYKMSKIPKGSGQFSLKWTPSVEEDGQSHPVCFVVNANLSVSVYQSELRCVIVTVGNSECKTTPITSIVILKMKLSTSLSLEHNTDTILTKLKQEMVKRGLSPNVTLRLVSSKKVTPGG